MKKKEPLISVIITAHNRRDFIIEAMGSLVAQSLPKDQFEVIIVKNYEDVTIDSFANVQNYRLILTQESNVGSKIATGISNCKGRWLCFLEDDDKFYSDKLKRLSEMICMHEGAVYYHNGYSINELSENEKAYTQTSIGVELLKGDDHFLYQLSSLGIRLEDFALMSTISIEKSLIGSNYLDHLRNIKSAPDFFMLLCFLESEKTGIMDSMILTDYRLHHSMSNVAGLNEDGFIAGNKNIREKWVDDYTEMELTFFKRSSKLISMALRKLNEVFYLFLSDELPKRKSLSKSLGLLDEPAFFRTRNPRKTFLFLFAGNCMPLFMKTVYYWYRKNNNYLLNRHLSRKRVE